MFGTEPFSNLFIIPDKSNCIYVDLFISWSTSIANPNPFLSEIILFAYKLLAISLFGNFINPYAVTVIPLNE
jgi:hypothetical protein